MEFLKYIWRPIEGLIIFDCPMEISHPHPHFDTYTNIIKLAGLPLAENFTYRWTLGNEGWGEVSYVTVSHTPTGRKVCATSNLRSAQMLLDSILIETEGLINWDDSDLEQFTTMKGKLLPKDFQAYQIFMDDTTEPVSYKDWEKANG